MIKRFLSRLPIIAVVIASVLLISFSVNATQAVTEGNVVTLAYGDRYIPENCDCFEIADAGKPVSFKVGYGVNEGTPDDAVLKIENGVIRASGIGEAVLKVVKDGEETLYTVKVEKAPISMFLLIGQSNMSGVDGNASQSVACENGQVYSTYGDTQYLTQNNAGQFVPSALEGEYTNKNTCGNSIYLSLHPVNTLTVDGEGKMGLDSALAYEWNRLTGDKVWVVNAAHGGTPMACWVKGGSEYNEAVAMFSAAQKVMRAEIDAGHYELKNYGFFWLQGCSDDTSTAEKYYNSFMSMYNSLISELAYDVDGDGKKEEFEFCDIIMPRAGKELRRGYRRGKYTDTTSKRYYTTFLDLEMRGQRVAQYYLCNTPGNNINLVCNLGDSWVYMPDSSHGVKDYFESKYPDGRVNYPIQVQQKESWYTPTTPEAVHDNIHYNQVGYNEIGFESARNAAYTHGRVEKPDVPVSVTFYDWTGYRQADTVKASNEPKSSTLIVPVVYPVYESKSVTYELSDTNLMSYTFYDLTVQLGHGEGLTLTSVGASENKTVTVTGISEQEIHCFTEYLPDNNATCTEDGTRTAYCDNYCGLTDVITDKNTKLGHSFTQYTYDGNATCSKDGTKTALCDNGCGEKKSVTAKGTATDHSFTVYRTEPATYVKNRTYVSVCDFCSATDSYEDKNTRLKLLKPGYITATATTNSVTLTWGEVKGATGYRIYVRNKITGKWEILVNNVTTTNYKVTGLSAGKSYSYAVKAFAKDKITVYASTYASISVKTKKITDKQVTATNVKDKSVTLKWDKIKDAYGYRVYKLNKKTGKWETLIKNTTDTTAVVNSLSSGQSYVLAVRSYSKNSGKIKWSAVSDMLRVTVLTAPSNVKTLSVSATEKTVNISWKKVSGATGYRVYMKTANGWKALKTTTSNQYTVTGLKPATAYIFAVKSYIKSGNETVWSYSYTEKNLFTVPSVPSKVDALVLSDKVTLSWKKTGGETGYRVYLYNTSTKKWEIAVKSTKNLKVVFEGLEKGKTYKFAVRPYVYTGSEYLWAKTYTVVSVTV